MVFFLPFMEVPFLEYVFILKLSNILAIVIILLFLRDFILGKRKLSLPFFVPLSVFMAISAVSILQGFRLPLEQGLEGAVGRNAPMTWSFVTLFWMIFAVFLFWTAVNAVRKKDFLINIARVHLVSAALVSLWGIWTVAGYLSGINTGLKFTEIDWVVPRLNSTILEPLLFGNYLLSATPLGLALYLTRNDIFNRHFFLFLLITQLSALALTFSLGAWAGLAIGAVFFAVFFYSDISWRRAATIAFILLVFFAGSWLALSRRSPNIRHAPGIVVNKFANIFKKTSYRATADFNRVDFISYDTPEEMKPGMYAFLKIKVRNSGTRAWRAGGKNAVHLTYTWVDSRGETKNMLQVRTWLPRDVAPGGEAELSACLRAPEKSGDYLLKWDMLEESIGFFREQKRSLPLTLKVKVSGPVQFYKADIRLEGVLPGSVITGRKYTMRARLKNTGTITWNCRGGYPVRLGYRWFDREGKFVPVEGVRTLLPRDIHPGEEISVKAEFEKYPGVPEGAFFQWDMVKESVAWFSEQHERVVYYGDTGEGAKQPDPRMNLVTITERWGLWRAGFRMFKEHPLIGVGLGNFSFLYNRYKPEDAIYLKYHPVIHNLYLEILVETGLLGFSAFVFFIVSLLRVFIRKARSIRDHSDSILFFGLLSCLAGMAFQFNLYGGKTLNYLWILLGLTAAAAGILGESDE